MPCPASWWVKSPRHRETALPTCCSIAPDDSQGIYSLAEQFRGTLRSMVLRDVLASSTHQGAEPGLVAITPPGLLGRKTM